jgi:hypothetical protein
MQYGAGRYTDCMSTEHQHVTHGVRNFARTSKKITVASEMLFNTIKMKVADTLHRKMACIEDVTDENGYVSSDDSVLSVDKFANLPTYRSEKIFFENGALMHSLKIAQGIFEKKNLSGILHPFLSEDKIIRMLLDYYREVRHINGATVLANANLELENGIKVTPHISSGCGPFLIYCTVAYRQNREGNLIR